MARMAGKVAEDFFLQCVILASPDPGAGRGVALQALQGAPRACSGSTTVPLGPILYISMKLKAFVVPLAL